MNILLMSLACVIGFNDPADSPVLRDRVDLMELNHFYDEKGKLVFDQVIYYDWSPQQGRYMVRDWKLLKVPGQDPIQQDEDGDYVAAWYDGEWLRVVRSPLVHESWTQYDPELVEREFLPKEDRAELSRPKDPKIIRR